MRKKGFTYFKWFYLLQLVRVLILKFISLSIFINLPVYGQFHEGNANILSLEAAIDSCLLSHPVVRNAEYNLQIAVHERTKIPNIGKTDVYLMRGQFFSGVHDNQLFINQNFGSVLTHIAEKRYSDTFINSESIKKSLDIKSLKKSLKCIYFNWLHYYNKLNIMENYFLLISDIAREANGQHELGEISLLKKTMVEVKTAKIKALLEQTMDDYLIAENNLRLLTFIESEIMPPASPPEMYEIEQSLLPFERYINVLTTNYEESLYQLKVKAYEIEKTRYFPDLSVGYFYREINNVKGFSGWGVGISIPLWYMPQRANIKKAMLQKEIAFNNWQYEKMETGLIIENIKNELNKHFRKITYFNLNALNYADLLIQEVIGNWDMEGVNISEQMDALETAFEINLSYLETLNNYNQAAIELEYYAN